MLKHPAPIHVTLALACLLALTGCAPGMTAPPGESAQANAQTPAPKTDGALQCAEARFKKTVMLTRVWLPSPPQDVVNLGAALSKTIATDLQNTGHFHVETTEATQSTGPEPAVDAFKSHGTPYFIRISGHNFGLSGQASMWSFLGPSLNPRGGTLDIRIVDALTTQTIAQTTVSAPSVKAGVYDPVIDALGTDFGASAYGRAMNQIAGEAANWIDRTLGCKPLIGQVVHVDGATITINRGINDGLRSSDRLLILQRTDRVYQPGQDAFTEQYLLQNLGAAEVARLGEHTSRIHYGGQHVVQVGDIVQSGN
jgi:curli biogenesis system outer membrane secretion channel CsgG